MKPYPAYKDTNIVWIGSLPEHWDVSKIKYNTYVKGRIGWQGLRVDERVEQGAYLVTGTDFEDGRVNWESCSKVTEDRYDQDPYIQLQENDLLITKDGTIGKIALVQAIPHKATLNSGIFVTRPINDEYRTKFLFWLLHSSVFDQFIDFTKTGTTIVHLYQNVFHEFAFPIPSIEEQQAIADYLDRKTAVIDTLIAKKERQIALLQEQKTAVINHAVTKGLNPHVPLKDSGIPWLGQIPSHWDIARIKHVAKLESGHTPSRQHPEYWQNCTIKWFSLKDVWQLRDERNIYVEDTAEYVSELGLANSSARLLPANTVILSRTASVGFSGILAYPMATTQDFVNWICGELIEPEYMLFVFRSMKDEFGRLLMGSTHKTIYMPDAEKFMTPLPPLEEQKQIVNYVKDRTAKIYSALDNLETTIGFLKEYRTAVISAAVTGKIDVREAS